MDAPEVEILFEGARISFTDADGDSVWFTRHEGNLIVETDDTVFAFTEEQEAALLAWLRERSEL